MEIKCQFCPDSSSVLLEDDANYVCMGCGTVLQTYLRPQNNRFGENVNVCVYSRSKRFEIMLRALLYPAFDVKDETMYKHLARKAMYGSLEGLRNEMKRCTIKEKRFHSLHLFATLLCPNHISPKPPEHRYFKRIMILFDELLCQYNSKKRKKFFSYPWLIRKLLNVTNEYRYDSYIKKIRCKKRNAFYETLYKTLVTNSPQNYLIRECAICK